MKKGFIAARSRKGGINLGLAERLGVMIWWQGKGGLTISRVQKHIQTMMQYEDPPNFIMLHVGANDIGNVKFGLIQLQLKSLISWIAKQMQYAKIIFSQLLPRLSWRYSENNSKMEKCRHRINSAIASFIVKNGGYYIHYPDIKADNQFLVPDGVHLNELGNNILLNIIQGAIETFIYDESKYSFPY